MKDNYIHIRVSEKDKSKWIAWAKKNRYSLTELITEAIKRFIGV